MAEPYSDDAGPARVACALPPVAVTWPGAAGTWPGIEPPKVRVTALLGPASWVLSDAVAEVQPAVPPVERVSAGNCGMVNGSWPMVPSRFWKSYWPVTCRPSSTRHVLPLASTWLVAGF